jgi:hypothetical protein
MTPRCRKVLGALESAKKMGLAAIYLAQPHLGGLDYRKRCSELRQMGYDIRSYPIPKKPYNRYVLEGKPNNVSM